MFVSAFSLVPSGINEREQQLLLQQILKPIWLETHHTPSVRKYRISGFGASTLQHTFLRSNDDNTQERQSVYDYFREKYQIHLEYPDLPTLGSLIRSMLRVSEVLSLELYNYPNKAQCQYLPMECCTIQAWQRAMKPLTTDQRARVTKKTVINPTQRYEAIMDIVRTRDFREDSHLQTIGIRVDDERMLVVPARCIPPPEIKYKSGRDGRTDVVERISIGK